MWPIQLDETKPQEVTEMISNIERALDKRQRAYIGAGPLCQRGSEAPSLSTPVLNQIFAAISKKSSVIVTAILATGNIENN
jgi:hypothetical protein